MPKEEHVAPPPFLRMEEHVDRSEGSSPKPAGWPRPPSLDIGFIKQQAGAAAGEGPCSGDYEVTSPGYFSAHGARQAVMQSTALSPGLPRWISGNISYFYNFDPNSKPIGEGSFGKVFPGTNKESRARVAIKMVARRGARSTNLETFKQEYNVAKELDHPYIVRIYDIFVDSRHWYIAQELCTGGDLFTHLKMNGPCSEMNAASLVEQCAAALSHLHLKGIVYRDLKTDNIMLKCAFQIADNVRLIDFGMCAFVNQLDAPHDDPPRHAFVAPEIRAQDFKKAGSRYGPLADMWSLGILAYEVVCGLIPVH